MTAPMHSEASLDVLISRAAHAILHAASAGTGPPIALWSVRPIEVAHDLAEIALRGAFGLERPTEEDR